ncbi:MAG: TenA family protein [Leptolyngbyaceae cyanobacterium SL_7_1]|nr:TenA family protein [Leptolyngbyaceae cyanobacterium SL_7_1]
MHSPPPLPVIETRLAETLWDANEELAIACLHHPFVQGIANGSLPKPTFAHYVGQDAFFLEAFARAYSVAAAKAPDWRGFQVFNALATGVLQELQLHQTYATQWQVDLQAVQPGSSTRRYTDFLLATAWSQDVGTTIAAMLPCMRLYAFLGETLAETSQSPHAYTDWIHTYSSTEFIALAEQLAQLAQTYTQETPEVRSTYRYAMQCELDFFQSAWLTN